MAVDLPLGSLKELSGNVRLLPLLVALKTIKSFKPKNINDEFGYKVFDVKENQILGIGKEQIIEICPKDAKEESSPIKYDSTEKLEPDEFQVATDDDEINVLINPETDAKRLRLNQTPNGQTIILNSIVLPVIMEVLQVIKECEANKDTSHDSKRWYVAFRNKLEKMEVDLNAGFSLLATAIEILEQPFSQIESDK